MRIILFILHAAILASVSSAASPDHYVPAEKNLDPAWVEQLTARGRRRPYSGEELYTIGMPCGGVAAGQLYVRGDGTLAQWWIGNNGYGTAVWWEPFKPETRKPIRFETPVGPFECAYRTYRPPCPIEQGFRLSVGDASVRLSGDDFERIEFFGEYPIAEIRYGSCKKPLPVSVTSEVFSPFIPLNARDSANPATIVCYRITNTSDRPVEATVTGFMQNPVCLDIQNQAGGQSRNAVLRHDGMTCLVMDLAPPEYKPNLSRRHIVFEDFESGYEKWTVEGTAFGKAPATGTLPDQQAIAGFRGKGLVNSYLGGDGPTGRLVSRPFRIELPYVTFLIGCCTTRGETGIRLVVDGAVIRRAEGTRNTKLVERTWDVREWTGREAHLEIFDAATGGWGHVVVDEIVFTDVPPESPFPKDAPQFGNVTFTALDPNARARADRSSEGEFAVRPLGKALVGSLATTLHLEPGETRSANFLVTWYFPNRRYDGGGFNLGRLYGRGERVGQMYSNWYNNSLDVARYLRENFTRLVHQTHCFRDTYYDTTLPYWFVQRISMPAANLATETVQWWENGRFYGWEGVGSCEGTCTHVWHYEQALGRLFPELAQSIREKQNYDPENGFRKDGGIPDRGRHGASVATDGHCGVILASWREHLMSADDAFLSRNWPSIKRAIEYLIDEDGNGDGMLEGEQPNTYDIPFYGANTFSGSLYLACLRAGEEMATRMRDPEFARRCREIFKRGREESLRRLWNGEYFTQDVDLEKHPRWQYVQGCLSDQLIGQGWARQLGLGDLYPEKNIRSALESVWRCNWAPDVGPQSTAHPGEIIYADPGEAGLFLCTWPKTPHPGMNVGVRYCNTVWSGIEGQVAAHMIAEGMTTEGLAILRGIHERHNGTKHNPWNQILCGDHYARAMSSYGALITASGLTYDGPAGRLGFAPVLDPDDFKAFFTGAEGWGSLVQARKDETQENRIELAWGKLRLGALEFRMPDGRELSQVHLRIDDREIPVKAQTRDSAVQLAFDEQTLLAGQTLSVHLKY